MKTNNLLSLIIPTYNESQNIQDLIAKIEKMLNSIHFEIIIVDDNSPDGTDKIAEALNDEYGNIRVCRRSGKFGLSSAVLYGFENSSGNILGVIDADFQHPPEILPRMYAVLQTHDLVVASRYIQGGRIFGLNISRKILSKGAGLLAYAFFPKTRKVKDTMSGCFMVKRKVVEDVEFNPIGYKILLEILVKCQYNAVCEVPYVFNPRKQGNSNLDMKEVWNYIHHISRLLRIE